MSRTVRFKLSEAEHKIVLNASHGLGISVDELARQALAYILTRAQELSNAQTNRGNALNTSGPESSGTHSEQSMHIDSNTLAD